jgi:hypothetical protein
MLLSPAYERSDESTDSKRRDLDEHREKKKITSFLKSKELKRTN